MRMCLFAAALAAVAGCTSGSQVDWPEVYPVTGTVTQAGKPLNGGNLLFHQAGATHTLVSGNIETDGTFTLFTAHAKDRGNRKPGAPAGKYRVMYTAPFSEPGGSPETIDLPGVVSIEARENSLKLDLPRKK